MIASASFMLASKAQTSPTTPAKADPSVRHALFIAFHYPPEASSSGVLRTLKYTRFLPEFGWRVSVIAPDTAAYDVCDPSLEAQIPESVRIVRTRFLNTKRHLSWRGIYPALLALPDVWIGWLPWAVAAGRRLIAADRVDLLYSTSPHATAHIIARRLASSSGKPWVTDFRDPWIEDPPEPGAPRGAVYRRVDRWLERDVIRRSSAVVGSTTALRDALRERYSDQPREKFSVIVNGYDESDFTALPSMPTRSAARLRFVHAGSINPEFRDPRPFFAALADLFRGNLRTDECEVRFIGGGAFGDSPEIRAAIEAAGLAACVTFVPRVPYEQSLQELAAADVLLLLQASDDTVGLVPAKLYEYLRAQKPTLALVREGAVSEVMAQTRGGWAVDPRDSTRLGDVLGEIVGAWRGGTLSDKRARLEVLRQFDRRSLAGELANLFDVLVEPRAHPTAANQRRIRSA